MFDPGLNRAEQGGILLGIDTSGANGSLALARIDAESAPILRGQKILNGRTSSAELIPRLRELFSEAGVVFSGLSAIVAVSGPGSFTGLRIGLSAAKAFAEAGSLPLLAVSRLAILSSLGGDIAAVLDAGRGEYYLRTPSSVNAAAVESLVTEPMLLDTLRGERLCICEPSLGERLAVLGPRLLPSPQAIDAIRMALPRFLQHDSDDVALLDANYARPPYAQMTPALKQ